MRTTAVLVMSLAMLGCGDLRAADDAQILREKQLERLGAMKGRIQSKMTELPKLLDPAQNGAAAMQAAIPQIQQKITADVARQAQMQLKLVELQKLLDPNQKGAAELTAAIQQLQQKMAAGLPKPVQQEEKKTSEQKLGEIGQAFATVLGNYTKKLADMQAIYLEMTRYVIPSMPAEAPWIGADLDVEILISAWATVEKGADDLKSMNADALAELKKTVTTWEPFLKE